MVKIHTSRNTVGCNVGGNIFVHPELHKYPRLYNAVVSHERRHSNSFKGRDVSIDIVNDELKGHKKEFYSFIFHHPRTLLGYLPVTKVGKYWGFDLEMLAVWIFLVGMIYYLGVNL